MYTNQMVSTFKERLSVLCDKSNKNDTEIATALGISKQTLSAWKCGTRSPRRPVIEHIARYFEIPLDWLMGFDVPDTTEGRESKKPIPEDELDNEIINLLQDLSPQEIARVVDFVAGLKAARAGEASRGK